MRPDLLDVSILLTIDRLTARDGYSPTLAEIAAETEATIGTVHYRCTGLIGRGLLTSEPGKMRSRKVTDKGRQVIGFLQALRDT